MPELDSKQSLPRKTCDHIFFVGFLGAGKSTLAKNLGRMFHRRYVDTDRLVERQQGMSVTQIFASEGESAFRRYETAILQDLALEQSLLVSCGGGIIETEQNIELMRDMGYVVHLDGDLEDSLRQIRRADTRPDFQSVNHARELFWHRLPRYQAVADMTIDIRRKSFTRVAYEVAELLLERDLL
ncbi:shikimate kinase [Collinsella sp. zg1085]|uniref:shikimate kinase n=1 Tax=Collinsella sp. zg1085 TaxID=2844380 RepID=UPI001C0B9ACA|nr:shikimate kinase [Collinsella sp. zg1085]QWT17084.1 shikimate kinase [Collinsella sp. zg1085]